ncbi:hypothetical protein FPV67DRAFT_304596 [Lyophyllum atratum]|nr:hypothetical protein FPV67DRAFT_304596 [Lyophyllum atratum]
MPGPSVAARSQGLVFAKLSDINVAMRRSTSMLTTPSQSHSSSSQSGAHSSDHPPHIPTSEQVARELLEDQRAFDQELKRYEDDGVAPVSERKSDLTRHWKRQEHLCPLLFRVAWMSSPHRLPCERVSSSSKETCRLSPKLMEALQMLNGG